MRVYVPGDERERAAQLVEYIETFVREVISQRITPFAAMDTTTLDVARDNLATLLALSIRRD